jgi:hypothetical protein
MTAVRSADSAKYGIKLFAYLLVVVLIGGGGIALGVAIGLPEARALLGPGSASRAELAGGAVLAFLGLVVLLTGLLGMVYKLIADAVAAGVSAGSLSRQPEARAGDTEAEDRSPAAEGRQSLAETEERRDEPTESTPAPGEKPDTQPEVEARSEDQQSEVQGGTGQPETTPEEWNETPRSASDTDDAAQSGGGSTTGEADDEFSGPTPPDSSRRKPSPEEIAFGSGEEEPPEREESTETRESVETAGNDASGDPLADPTDDE